MRSEYLEGRVFCAWLRSKNLRFSHIPLESPNLRTALAKKARGAVKGVPDYLIVIPPLYDSSIDCRQPVAGVVLFVELKRKTGGRVTKEQKEWCAALTAAGCPARVCRGAEEAQRFVEEFL